ncbi:MAG TPA: SUMF1/EgtB/PvdO family nonheme iron enzyme, partial [Bacteroidales bacterium]|nr:SUMF1/EgtB/PvdO family nonheme iron enzyme [Bacteroidales bacterium]
SYDVYADATPNPQTRIAANLTATSFSYKFNTYGKLYWKVVVRDASGLSDTSGVFSFTTWDKAPDFTIEMADIEGSTFNMGQSKVKIITDPYYVNLEDEWPEHQVRLDDYRMAKMEITNEQYVKFLNAIVNRTTIMNSNRGHGHYGFYYRNVAYNGRDLCQIFDSTETGRPVGYEETYDSPVIWNGSRFSVDPKFTKHPVRFMYAYGAELFAEWAGNYRLPTEAEWEFAAMGGKLSQGYEYSGSNNYKEVAVQNIGGPIDGKKYTQPVGSLKPNELGIYDMTGNVEEICSDCYKADFYPKPEASGYNPLNRVCSGLERVIRGGNFSSPQAVYIRIKKRDYLGYSQITDKSGIRLVKSRENNEFSISGTVAGNNGVPIENVTLGGFSQEVRSNNSGLFSSTETSGWSGTITPQAEGYTFSPDKFEIKNLSDNLANVNFTAIPVITDYTITGKVSIGDGIPLQNVIIKLGTVNTSTNVNGEFSVTVAKGWEGSLIPEMGGYTFTPEKIDIASLQGNLSGKDFTAIPITKYYAVSGTIADSDGIRLANIGIEGFSGSVVTTSDGVFFSREKEGWSGIITPASPNYTFDPASWSISNLQKDSAISFTARLITSVSKLSSDKDYKLFPNPTKGMFKVQFPGERACIKIYDIVGNLVFDDFVNNGSEITLMNKGVFIVNIHTDNDLFVDKIVVE